MHAIALVLDSIYPSSAQRKKNSLWEIYLLGTMENVLISKFYMNQLTEE